MRNLGNQLAIKDKGVCEIVRHVLFVVARQSPHCFFQLRTIWVVTAARMRRRVLL